MGRKLYANACIAILVILFFGSFAQALDTGAGTVYVIPIKGEIGPAVSQFVNSQIENARADKNSVAIIFEIDTLGGRVDQATIIRDTIMKTPLKTISLVNNKAESAGVLITISAEKIVMAPGSTIGSAETIPDTEKALSYWKGELRTTAQQRGRDAQLVESMADRRMEIPHPTEEGKYIVQQGQLLNLTTKEAEEFGFTDYVSNDYHDILKHFDIQYDNIVEVQPDLQIKATQWVTSSIMLPIILSIGFIGLIVELLTPGFGIGGTISFVAFSLFFGGSFLAGNASTPIILLFITGIALLIIEMIIPGFGAPGIGGILCIIISIILASDSFALGVFSLLTAFVMTVIAAILLLKYGPKNKYFDRIILNAQLRKDVGFISTPNHNDMLFAEGLTITALRPSGTIEVNGKRFDVVSQGEFIEPQTKVRIISVEGRRIIVEKTS
ncbi:MAG: NfeD family protein [Bacillota bacterium]